MSLQGRFLTYHDLPSNTLCTAAGSCLQEKLEQQHCEDYSLWSEELLRGREKARALAARGFVIPAFATPPTIELLRLHIFKSLNFLQTMSTVSARLLKKLQPCERSSMFCQFRAAFIRYSSFRKCSSEVLLLLPTSLSNLILSDSIILIYINSDSIFLCFEGLEATGESVASGLEVIESSVLWKCCFNPKGMKGTRLG
jgi:hypothetical protein